MSRVVRAVYFAFLLWLPIETIDLFQKQADSRVLSVSRLLGLLLLLLVLIDWRRSLRRIPAELWPIAWYLLFYSASQAWLPAELDQSFLKKQVVLSYSVVVFLISANVLDDTEFRGKALRFYGWLIGVVAAAMLLGAFGAPTEAMEGRDTILGQDPNVTAGFFASGAICIAGDPHALSLRRSALSFLLAPAAVGALILGILQTGSRGGLLALAAGIAGLALCGGKLARGKRIVIALALVAALGLLIRREFQQHTNTAARLESSWTDGDTAGRDKIYKVAWSMFRERPLLGYGGAMNNYVLARRLHVSVHGLYQRDTHNMALDLLTSVGLVGALPMLALILYATGKAWLHGKLTGDAIPFALMCAQLMINMSLTGINQNLFWIVLAVATAVS